MVQSPTLDGEWRFALHRDPTGSSSRRLVAHRRSGDEWVLDGVTELPVPEEVEVEQALSCPVESGGLDPDLPKWMDRSVFAVAIQRIALVSALAGEDLDHLHFTVTGWHRWNEEGDLMEYNLTVDLSFCPVWGCRESDDHGIEQWHRSPQSGRLVDAEGRKARSEEELAKVAIQKVCLDAKVRKIPEVDGSPDLAVDFPEQSEAKDALVEVTMHTDRKKREIRKASPKRRFKSLRRDWIIRCIDSRGVGSYDQADFLAVNQIPPMLADALRKVEHGGIDDFAHVADVCEQAIAQGWPQVHGATRSGPPVKVIQATSEPTEGPTGSVSVSVAPCVFNFRNVVDVSDFKSAIRACIDSKLVQDQWGDTEKDKWLVVILDDTEAATQLLGDAFAFEDHTPDFSNIRFPEIDEVWAVALDDGRITVLRFQGSGAQWKPYLRIPLA